jgi:hypothetical protein
VAAHGMMRRCNGISGTAIILIATLITTILASFIIVLSTASLIEAISLPPIRNDGTLFLSSDIESFPQPVYQENITELNLTSVSQTHATFTFSGNGMLTIPTQNHILETTNGMLTIPTQIQTLNTTSNGTGVVSFATSSGYARETIKTQDDNKTLTATFYEIVDTNATTFGGGRGIVTALFQANSTGMLHHLNGTIAVGVENIMSGGESQITLWRWESGSSNNENNSSSGTSDNNNNNNSTNTIPALPARGGSPMNATVLVPKSPIAKATVVSTDTIRETGVYPFFGFLEGEDWSDRIAANHSSMWIDTEGDRDTDDEDEDRDHDEHDDDEDDNDDDEDDNDDDEDDNDDDEDDNDDGKDW